MLESDLYGNKPYAPALILKTTSVSIVWKYSNDFFHQTFEYFPGGVPANATTSIPSSLNVSGLLGTDVVINCT